MERNIDIDHQHHIGMNLFPDHSGMHNADLADKNYVPITFSHKLKPVNAESVNKAIKMNILKVPKLTNPCLCD